MSKANDIASLYKTPKMVNSNGVEGNSFIDMLLQTKATASAAFDKLAYLAGIKNAPADDKYAQLNTSSLSELMESAKSAGYDVEIVSI
ncbi:hypothetical protein [Dickeya zeae]|uniref:hypothetical protein n=1 Tax=Dickeya zeae TaxID=204042 RepID=UPI0003154170|nr:hypothetical protein [Dickeya zeae]AJC64911.1 XRE family transcriptional regulator [Dickeya zeae EC1]